MDKTNSQVKIKKKSGEDDLSKNRDLSDTGKEKLTNTSSSLDDNGVSGTKNLEIPKASLLPSNSGNEAIGKQRGSSDPKKTPSLIPRLKNRKPIQTHRVQSKVSDLNCNALAANKTESPCAQERSRTPLKDAIVEAENEQNVLPSSPKPPTPALSTSPTGPSTPAGPPKPPPPAVSTSPTGPSTLAGPPKPPTAAVSTNPTGPSTPASPAKPPTPAISTNPTGPSTPVTSDSANAAITDDHIGCPESLNIQQKFTELSQELRANSSLLKNVNREREHKTDNATDPREIETQEIALQYLYETIKYTTGPLFDKHRWNFKEKPENSKKSESLKATINVQLKYEYTLHEISEIWKNTISLIRSVKDHTIEFVDKGSQSVDREQIILEAEMMQLAVDFAINYSKLKSDFFLKWLRQYLNTEKPVEKSELENFFDSKTCAALYNSDDLDAMARTVADLTASVLKGEDFALK